MWKLLSLVVVACLLNACGSGQKSQRYQAEPEPADRPENLETNNNINNNERDQNNDRTRDARGDNRGRRSVDISNDREDEVQDSDCIDADPAICAIEARILALTNEARAGSGLSPLENDAKVAYVSRDWSKQQAASGGIGHQGFPSQRILAFLQKFGFQTSMTAENVAYSYFRGSDADAVAQGFMNMWLGSAGHRRNILGRHQGLGVGIYRDGNGAFYATQIFTR